MERQEWKWREPADPDNQRPMKVLLTRLFSPGLSQSLWFPILPISHCHRIFLLRLISVPMAATVPQFFCPWSKVQCYSQLWLRTQEGHHLVTRCLFQMPLQGGSGHHCGGLWPLPSEHVSKLCLSCSYKDTQVFDNGCLFLLQCCD